MPDPTINQFSLLYQSDLGLDDIVVYEDGVPVTHDLLEFLDASTVKINNSDPNRVYTVDYNILTRFESQPLSLPTNFSDYVWYSDFHRYDRLTFVPNSGRISVGVQFGFNFIATLSERADLDATQAILVSDDGFVTRNVPSDAWSFIDPTTIQIDSNIFNPAALYMFTYNTNFINPTPYCSMVVEIRWADSSGGLATAIYAPCEINQIINSKQWFQMRATITDIQDPDDIKLYSLLVKGLNVGMINPDQASNNPLVNVIGVFTDTNFNSGALVNLDVIPATPARFSYVKPSVASRIAGESVTLSMYV